MQSNDDAQKRRERLEHARSLRRRMTPEETALWHRLRTNKLDGLHFRRQHVIDDFVVDFYCPAARLVIELDGPAHQASRDYDAERDETLRARGLFVLRSANAAVHDDIEGVLQQIAEIARARLAEHRSASST